MNKKISIITVTFNSGKTLERTIQSIINQSFNDYEYIIIDGGSTDNTLDIIKNYEKYITFWSSEPDKGIYDAMNKGITQATGEWIHILNSDDYYHNDSVLNDISRLLISEDEFYYFSMIQKGEVSERKYSWNSFHCLLWYSAYIPHPTMFVSKKTYSRVGLYNLNYKIAADHDYILRLIRNGVKPVFFDIVCTVMTMGGISSLDARVTFNDFKNVTIDNGLNKILAEIIYSFKMIKHNFRN